MIGIARRSFFGRSEVVDDAALAESFMSECELYFNKFRGCGSLRGAQHVGKLFTQLIAVGLLSNVLGPLSLSRQKEKKHA